MDFLKKINEFLQKSGMLRFGSYKGTFKNAKESADQMIPGYEYKSVKEIDKEFNSSDASSGNNPEPNQKRSGFFWVALIIAIIFGLFFLLASGFSFWFLVFIFIWFFFIRFLKKTKSISMGKAIGFGVLMIIASFVLMSFSVPEDGSSIQKSGKVDIADLKKYDGQVLKISSVDGDLEGVAKIKIKEDEKSTRPLEVSYYVNIVEDLPTNKVCFTCESNSKYDHNCRSYDKYNYAGKVYGASGMGTFNFFNQVYPVFCDKFKNPMTISESPTSGMLMGCFDKQVGKDIVTNKFYYYQWATYESYDQLLENNKFSIYDAKEYMTRNSCVNGKVGSSEEGMDAGEAVKQKESIVDFIFQFSEE